MRESSPILVTDLHNYGMPFIRYAIGDSGSMVTTRCNCGRALPRLLSIDGRELDVLRTVDGIVVPGEFFPHLLKDIPEIREYQVAQRALDRIEISAVISGPLSEPSRALLQSEIAKVFGTRMQWEVKSVDRILRLASGKQRVTIGMGV
jgi:phenylacetate-CoA ligase